MLVTTQGWRGLAVILAVIAALFAVPSTAAAIDGWERHIGTSPIDDEPSKLARAECSPGKRVVGGGAAINDGNRKRVRLVGLSPSPSSFVAIAEAPHLFSGYDWSVTAYAICVDADELSRYQIVSDSLEVPATGGPFAHTAARCPSGTIAYGAGGTVVAPNRVVYSYASGQIGLQMSRTSGPQDIARIAAREQTEGSVLRWTLRSHAICAEPPAAMNVRGASAPGDEARAWCDSGWKVIGPGGGGGLTDGGAVWLQDVIPQATTPSVIVRMTGPLYPSIGGMAVQMSCAL